MALGTYQATINGGTKTLVGATNTSGALAAGITLVDAACAALGTSANPVFIVELPPQGVIAMTVGQAQSAQRAVRIICTAAGNVSLTYADGSTDVIPVNTGLNYIPGAITEINSAGTTATATYANVK